MTKSSFTYFAVFCFFVVFIGSCKNKQQQENAKQIIKGKDTMVLVTAKPFQYQSGWGYDIIVGNKPYIHQNQVPAISGIHLFLTKEDAEKAGKLAVDKMKKSGLPSLDSMDLIKAGIRWN